MKWLYAALIVLSPALLYGVGLLVAAFFEGRPLRMKCPGCGQRTLFETSSGLWDDENGGGLFTKVECRTCGAKLQNYTGTWERVPDSDADPEP